MPRAEWIPGCWRFYICSWEGRRQTILLFPAPLLTWWLSSLVILSPEPLVASFLLITTGFHQGTICSFLCLMSPANSHLSISFKPLGNLWSTSDSSPFLFIVWEWIFSILLSSSSWGFRRKSLSKAFHLPSTFLPLLCSAGWLYFNCFPYCLRLVGSSRWGTSADQREERVRPWCLLLQRTPCRVATGWLSPH